jgi:Mrp family chromosome partitioning ATPase
MALDDEERFEDDDFDDTGRYGIPELTESEHGWEPPHEHQKALDEYRKKHPFIGPHDTMLEVRPAGKWITGGGSRSELFGSLWTEGEVAVLFGGSGTGKSILAVQIAEAIATGAQASLPATPQSGVSARRVLYLDFEHTTRQFAERYSAPSPIPGKPPVRTF